MKKIQTVILLCFLLASLCACESRQLCLLYTSDAADE